MIQIWTSTGPVTVGSIADSCIQDVFEEIRVDLKGGSFGKALNYMMREYL